MNRSWSILLLLAYTFAVLVPPSIKQELDKLDHLAQHYQEHRTETPDMSLFAFLKMHYGEQFDTHSADHNHTNLPGKTSQNHTHAMACGCNLSALPDSFSWSLQTPASQWHTLFPTEANLLSSTHGAYIWQPPKYS